MTPDVSVLTEDPCFASFAGILGEPGAVEATCQQLLSRLRGGNSIRWEELVNMNPTITLLELGLASSPTKKAVKIANQEEVGMLGMVGGGNKHALYCLQKDGIYTCHKKLNLQPSQRSN